MQGKLPARTKQRKILQILRCLQQGQSCLHVPGAAQVLPYLERNGYVKPVCSQGLRWQVTLEAEEFLPRLQAAVDAQKF